MRSLLFSNASEALYVISTTLNLVKLYFLLHIVLPEHTRPLPGDDRVAALAAVAAVASISVVAAD